MFLVDILEQQQRQNEALEYILGKPKLYNIKHIEYLNKDEYRLYEIPFIVGQSTSFSKAQYEEVDGIQINKSTGKQRTNESIEHTNKSSLNRTKQKIYDYAFSNDWSNGWFFTLTFDNAKIENRYDYDICYKRIYQFLKNIKDYNPDCKYLFVPEQHKDGAWHFHGILTNCDNLKMVDSGKYAKGKKIYDHEVKGSKKIYNVNTRSWKYGFTTATKIEDTNKVSSYITKYITKDMIKNTSGKHRYIYSKNLDIPIVSNELDDIKAVENLLTANKNFDYKKVYACDSTSNTITYIHIKK